MPYELHALEATPLCVAFDIAWQTAVTQTLHTSTPQNEHGAELESAMREPASPLTRKVITASNPTTAGPCDEESDRDAEINPLKQTPRSRRKHRRKIQHRQCAPVGFKSSHHAGVAKV